MNTNRLKEVIPYGAVVAALAGSFAAGYFLGKKQRVVVVPAEPDVAYPIGKITEMKETSTGIEMTAELAKPSPRQSAIMSAEEREAHNRLLTNYQNPASASPVDDVIDAEPQNVFAVSEGWDYDAEIASRDESKPYVIHKDEFYAEERGYSQTTLTFYEGDEVLADERDKVIEDVAGIIGEFKWGHGAPDSRTFFVRNPKLHGEYEVLKHDGRYSLEVLGMDAEPISRSELRHSRNRLRDE